MKKTSLVRFRCTEEERKIIEDCARNDGLSLSKYLLDLVKQDRMRRIEKSMTWEEFLSECIFEVIEED